MFLKVTTVAILMQHVIANLLPCPQVTFVDNTGTEKNGYLEVKSPSDVTWYKVLVSYEHPVISDDIIVGRLKSKLKGTESYARSNIFLGRNDNLRLPISLETTTSNGENVLDELRVTEIEFNHVTICRSSPDPKNTTNIENNENCADFEWEDFGQGHWEGSLNLHNFHAGASVKIDIEFDRIANEFNNDLAPGVTYDRKRFTIVGQYKNEPILFTGNHETTGMPQIKSLWVNKILTHVNTIKTESEVTTESPKSGVIRLQDLPFEKFPSVTMLPSQVDNDEFKCGLSSKHIRLNNEGIAQKEEFAFHSAIFRDGTYSCGGSLLSSKAVITVTHCVVDEMMQVMDTKQLKVLFGSIDLKTLSGDEALRDVKEIRHPEYQITNGRLKENIAVIIIEGKLQFSDKISPICLFSSLIPIPKPLKIEQIQPIIVGFGSNANSLLPNRPLMYRRMTSISQRSCLKAYQDLDYVLDPGSCARSYGNVTICPGDTGGGIIQFINGKYYLRGLTSVVVVSLNITCDPRIAVAFSDVKYFLPWINQNVDLNEPKAKNVSLVGITQVTQVTQVNKTVEFECGLSSISHRMNNGKLAEIGRFPFHAAIYRSDAYKCGGSLLSSKVVVTAAHCVVDDRMEVIDNKLFKLIFGAVDLKNPSEDAVTRGVEEIIKHPDYKKTNAMLNEDIAVIMIEGELEFSDTISPICLFDFHTPIRNHLNDDLTVLGFGSDSISLLPRLRLIYGQMTIISRRDCINSYWEFNNLSDDSAFCAKSVDNVTTTCPGDSGGGMILMSSGKYYLRGLISATVVPAGVKCDPRVAVAFSDVSFFLPWLKPILGEEAFIPEGFDLL